MSEATLHTVNGEPTLRFERRLRHSPAKVWRAVTDPAELVHWFPAAVEAELRPGAPMRFTFADEAPVDGEWDGEVLEVDEPKVFMFRWNTDVIRVELIPDGDGCLLVFTQTIGGGATGFLAAGRTAAGWDACLDALVARLGGAAVPEDADWLSRAEHYLAKFGLDEGAATRTANGWEIRFVRDLVWKPPADVWAVLTEGAQVGATPPVRATNETVPPGRVTRAEAPAVLAYEWLHDGEPAGTVRWELFSDPKLGVRVELTQTVPERLADVVPHAMAAWHLRLELFFAATQGDVRRAWPEERIAEMVKHYADATSPSS
ncbi:SRPBCC family protein [Actinophytocola sp. NPDC049390]|uniref:SRPBCC family protein n=1 Tax=Actinophytocola sp. NPDC049390 TaxID=3363894 RepID=UPI003795106F